MVVWLCQGGFYFILYVYFISDVLQWVYTAFLIRKKNHNLKYRVLVLVLVLVGMLSGRFAPRLCAPPGIALLTKIVCWEGECSWCC